MDTRIAELQALFTGYWLSDFANFCAFLFQRVPDLNWVGFYLSDGEKLRVGPFVGKPACTEIAFTRGVCGAAFTKNETFVVDDVHAFPGHISCDPDSRSELVIPLVVQGERVGVLDIDSPQVARFGSEEREFFSTALAALVAADFSQSKFPQVFLSRDSH